MSTDLELLRRLAAGGTITEDEAAAARSGRDYHDADQLESRAPGHTAPRLSDTDVCALLSDDARRALIGFEVTSEATYRKRYERPIAPAGDSGITIGIGYDLGYNGPDDVRRDLANLLAVLEIETLVGACGLKGTAARQRLHEFRDVVVPWDAALEVFQRVTVPRFGNNVLRTFPNASELKGHAFGALLSLVYNRGTKLDGDSRREMMTIRNLMAERNFKAVPQQFREMMRLWRDRPGMSGVVKRREAEAQLFERGLELMAGPQIIGNTASSLESNVARTDLAALDGDGRFYEELPDDGQFRESASWSKVQWAADDVSPDYRHIVQRLPLGSVFEFGATELEILLAANSFQPLRKYGRIIFALRGAELVASLTSPAPMLRQENRERLVLRDTRPDHNHFRCVMGVYDVDRQTLSGFAASTVPNRKAVATFVENSKQPANMMVSGRYRFEVGWHQNSNVSKRIPGCLVENGRRVRQKCVLRTTNDYVYDVHDMWDNAQPCGDNLHPGKSEASAQFSSWGCLVVSGSVEPTVGGDRLHVNHTGEWAQFRKALSLPATGTGSHGNEYDVILLTGLEAAIANAIVKTGNASDSDLIREHLGRLRQGSSGPRVASLQKALGLPATSDFDHAVTKALTERQRKVLGWADGVYAPAMDLQLGLDIFSAPSSAVASVQLESLNASPRAVTSLIDREARIDALHYEIGLYAETASREGVPVNDLETEAYNESLGATVLAYGDAKLKAIGASLAQKLERELHVYVCGSDLVVQVIDRDVMRGRIDVAARQGTQWLRDALVSTLVISSGALVPRPLIEKVVDIVIERLVAPLTGNTGTAVVQQIDGGVAMLCQRWAERLVQTVDVQTTTATPKTSTKNMVGPPTADNSSSPRSTLPRASDALLSKIEQCLAGPPPDPIGAQYNITVLIEHLRNGQMTLDSSDNARLVKAICESQLLTDRPRAGIANPHSLIDEIVTKSEDHVRRGKPLAESGIDSSINELHALLGDARVVVQHEEVARTLKALRSVRRYNDLAVMADRFVTRDPSMLGLVSSSYAQGLIDSGRVIAGIEVLHSALESATLTEKELEEVNGILGRGHKQIYVNHVRSASDATVLGSSITGQLRKAADSYRRHYDPGKPGENHYQGINYIALLKRAERDRVDIGANVRAENLARAMIASLEPGAAKSDDAWTFGSLGEAYLAIGDHENAARWYGAYANHKDIDGFKLNSTIRQLEEVWQLKAGPKGASAIVAGLKAALVRSDNGQLRLDVDERRAFENADHIDHQGFFETKTSGGKQIKVAEFVRIVKCASAVVAVQSKKGGRSTIGTGFLIQGADLNVGLDNNKSYILTNAHVLWDPNWDTGRKLGNEADALHPADAQIIFETDQTDGIQVVYGCKQVIWQSPSSLHDATLIELDRKVDKTKVPLRLAGSEVELVTDGEGRKATKLVVIGHPEGGSLSLGLSGSIDEMQGTLLDKGCRGNATDPVYLHYRTPTEPGNSGSPVFEIDKWQVVALHHAGFDEKQGRPRLGGKAGRHFANEGIWIDSIRTAIKAEARKRRKWW